MYLALELARYRGGSDVSRFSFGFSIGGEIGKFETVLEVVFRFQIDESRSESFSYDLSHNTIPT